MKYLLIAFLSVFFFYGNASFSPIGKADKTKVFISFSGSKSFLINETKYYSFQFGVNYKCKSRIGFERAWLRGTYKTDEYPVSLAQYPDAQSTTRTDAIFYSLFFEPYLITDKKVNLSVPLHIGVTDLTSEYKKSAVNYNSYHHSNPLNSFVGMRLSLRVLGFMAINFRMGYRYVATDLPVAKQALNTPVFGFGIKFGGMCKPPKKKKE